MNMNQVRPENTKTASTTLAWALGPSGQGFNWPPTPPSYAWFLIHEAGNRNPSNNCVVVWSWKGEGERGKWVQLTNRQQSELLTVMGFHYPNTNGKLGIYITFWCQMWWIAGPKPISPDPYRPCLWPQLLCKHLHAQAGTGLKKWGMGLDTGPRTSPRGSYNRLSYMAFIT